MLIVIIRTTRGKGERSLVGPEGRIYPRAGFALQEVIVV
jgi:hypothetical protein